MTVIDSCVGFDPGSSTGACFLEYCEGQLIGRVIFQAEGSTVVQVAKAMLATYYPLEPRPDVPPVTGRRIGSIERFVNGASAGTRGKPADVTRQLVMELAELLELYGYTVKTRPAADVKPWATNELLARALGIDKSRISDKLKDGYDAARHCVYGAHDAGVIAHPLRRRGAALASA